MIMQRRPLAAVAAMVLVLSLVMATGSLAQDAGTPDSVRIDSVVAYTNGIGAVPVNFYNDEPLAGLEVTLTVNSPDVQIDSFSFVGSRVDYISVKGSSGFPSAITIYAAPISAEPLIAAGNGLLGTLYLSWDVAVAPQVVPIDSITIVNVDVEYSTTFSNASAQTFTPQFVLGYIDIQQAYGCCAGMRGNVDNDPLDAVNVSDLTYLVKFLFQGGPPADCPDEADIDGLNGPEPNVADLTWLVAFLFQGGPDPVQCQ